MSPSDYLDWDTALSKLIKKIRLNNTAFEDLFGANVLIVLRDWRGQIHLGLPCSSRAFASNSSSIEPIVQQISLGLGPLSAAHRSASEDIVNTNATIENFVIFRDDLFDPDDIWDSPNLVKLDAAPNPTVFLLDRQDKESDWLKKSPRTEHSQTIPRAVFFGIKGGVGRSSALTALALSMANKGKNVLVIDADFESPGVSSSLLDANARPDYGMVDWLSAQALGLSELDVLAEQQMVETSPLSKLTLGKIVVAPSHGVLTEAYVSKLGRVYRTTAEGATFASRLNDLVSRLERLHQADVTLIDSRAGIDDTAAAAITQLGARVTFMFAINTQQTWDAYALLFSHLQRHPSLHSEDDFRSGLRLVSALTPEEAGYKGYWAAFREAAYQTCASGLYDEVEAHADGTEEKLNSDRRFNFGFDDEDAPHFPLRITWDEVLRAFDPVREPAQLAPPVMAKVFSDFLMRAERLLS